ncbi:MAG: 50S ribosomal protein L10 [Dehalococcoidia bacterium]|nr:50S ribosomal protein L10 [Dehalococcoidia bacterium]
MPSQKKVDAVQELRERIERCVIAIAAEYSGLTVPEISRLRRAIREAEAGELRVVKNRLFLRATQEAGRPEMAELLEGPTAIIFGYDDVVSPAKAVMDYIRSARNAFAVRKGVLDGQVLGVADIQALADLPPRPILAGQIAGALQAPIQRLVRLLSSVLTIPPGRLLNDSISTLAGLLEARAKQVEGA